MEDLVFIGADYIVFIGSAFRYSLHYSESMRRKIDRWFVESRITFIGQTNYFIRIPRDIYILSSDEADSCVRKYMIGRNLFYHFSKSHLPDNTCRFFGFTVIRIYRVVIISITSFLIHIWLTYYISEPCMIIIISLLKLRYRCIFESNYFKRFLIYSFFIFTSCIFWSRGKCNTRKE